jgi:hypothetical protein
MGGYQWVEVKRSYGRKVRGIVFKREDGKYDFYEENRRYPTTVTKNEITFLPVNVNIRDYEELIDFALVINDRDWFNELSSKYRELKKPRYI